MHHYTTCGRDDVWLVNGYIERDTVYGPAVAIVDIEQLHDIIAREPGALHLEHSDDQGWHRHFLRLVPSQPETE